MKRKRLTREQQTTDLINEAIRKVLPASMTSHLNTPLHQNSI